MSEGTARTGRRWWREPWSVLIAGVLALVVILQRAGSSSEGVGAPSSVDEAQQPTPSLAFQPQSEKRPDEFVSAEQPAVPPDPHRNGPVALKDDPKSYEEAVRQRQLERLEARWRSELVDPAWTRRVEETFLAEFRNREIRGRLSELDCRQTLCRLHMAFDSPDDAAGVNGIEHDVDTGWYSDFRLLEGDRVMVTAYLGGRGVDLRDIIDESSLR